jgi:hypothetical protein
VKLIAKVRGSCFKELDGTIDGSAKRGSKKRLVLLVTPFADEITFDVPSRFKSLTIIRCLHRQAESPYLAIDSESTYCGIPLPQWDVRKRKLDHKLELQSGVCLINRFGDPMDRAFSSEFEAAIKSQADRLQDKKLSMNQRKGLVASILGGLVAGTTAFKVYTCLDITAKGVFLQCQGIKFGMAGLKTFELGKMTFAAGSMKSSFIASASALGPPILIGAAAGVAVGALVYYVEWDSVLQWLENLWNGFWNWLVRMFKALRETVASWFQERGCDKESRRSSRSSHHAHRY